MFAKTPKQHLITVLVGCTLSLPAWSSGYHFGTQSASAQSTANSSSAEAADASTIFYNSAGLSKLSGTHFSINANLVAPSVKYSNASANYPNGLNLPIQGKTSGKITEDVVVAPHLYASHQLNDSITLGLGIYVPFGSETEYQRDSVLRYNVNKMGLTSIDINPTVAFKIDDQHSLGIGIIAQYTDAELRQYANLGRLNPQNPINGIEGYAKVAGNDWGFGYNLSYLWDVNDRLRLGINYRSKIDHTLTGTAQWTTAHPAFSNPALTGAVRAAGYKANEGARVKITTPESLSVHGMIQFDERWRGFGDITWTRHSRFNTLNIEYENPKFVANAVQGGATKSNQTIIKPEWRDTYKIGIGAAYQYSDDLQLRFGVAYDQSPVKGPDYRLSTLPDNDRIWFSLGAKYDINKNSSLNLGYSYIHIKDAKANVNGWCGSSTPAGPGAANCVSSRTNGTADFKSHAHILGIQYNYRF